MFVDERVVNDGGKLCLRKNRFEFGGLVHDLITTLVNIPARLDSLDVDSYPYRSLVRRGRIKLEFLAVCRELAFLEFTELNRFKVSMILRSHRPFPFRISLSMKATRSRLDRAGISM